MMKKKEIFRKIGVIINEITEQYQYLSEDSENLNELELELFVANVHFLSDHIAILQKLKENAVSTEGEIYKKTQITDLLDKQPQILKEEIPLGNNFFEIENEPIEQLLDTTKKDGLRQLIDQDSNAKQIASSVEVETHIHTEEPLPKISEEPVTTEVTVLERTISIPLEHLSVIGTNNHVPTINDILSEKVSQNTLVSQLSKEPVKELKSIISLNDKLLFIKDLFKGYSMAYNEAIEFVNRYDSFDDADKFLKGNYADKNNWKEKQDSVEKFYQILNRRFAK